MLERIIDVLLKVSGAEARVKRNERVIRILQQFNLDPEHPPSDFSDIYAYALVEYAFDERGDRKSEPLIKLFRTEAAKQLFRQAFEHNAPREWLSQGEALIARSDIGRDLRRLDIDLSRELAVFARCFLEIARKSRTPKETLAAHQVNSLQRQMQTLQRQIKQLPLAELHQTVNPLTGQTQPALSPAAGTEQTCRAAPLAQQLTAWFKVLGYDRESHNLWTENTFEWIITIPVRRRRYDRIVVRGAAGEADMADVQALRQSVERHNADEGWLVSQRRVSQAARRAMREQENEALSCYTFDELLDQDADFTGYLDWLEEEIQQRGIDTQYVPLACTKEELDPVSQQQIGLSHYGEADGWIDGYIDLWLDDPAKEHISILGEFGTGKTWFALHYAWAALQKYKQAKQRGVERPRLPLVIPLRDYAKAVSLESLFSEFFFRKHEIPLPGYRAFEQLNRMGKLLLIFDGFDEMAARVNRQAMINNFWELAKVVVPGAKAILTCRTEHFPEAREGRQLLNAELEASTANLTGESPQFEVLELEKLSDRQIQQVLLQKAQETTVAEIMGNSALLDLARRPVMVDLILEALPEIEAGKPIDISRVYLYATTRKMERDIKDERTFTSLADKLYFLCELSWEMLSTDQMSINYQVFPDRLRRLFGPMVQEKRDLDHCHYDMMGQTLLIRNSEGDYSPAHRSLLEFFAAYKIVASLGALADDFTDVARQQNYVNSAALPQAYTWADYFQHPCNEAGELLRMTPLQEFISTPFEELLTWLSQVRITPAVLDLAKPMLDRAVMKERLLPLIQATRGKESNYVGYLGGNITQLLLEKDSHALEQTDLSSTVLLDVNFGKASLRGTTLSKAILSDSLFTKALGSVFAVTFSPDGRLLALGDVNNVVQVWDSRTGKVLVLCRGHQNRVYSVVFSPDGRTLASSSSETTIKLWNPINGECLRTLKGHQDRVRSVVFSPDGNTLASCGEDSTIKLWNPLYGGCLRTLEGHQKLVLSIAFSPDGNTLATGGSDTTIKLWNPLNGECLCTLEGHQDWVRSVVFSPDGNTLVSGSSDTTIKLWNPLNGEYLRTLEGHQNWVRSVVFSPDSRTLASGSDDATIKLWNPLNGHCLHTLKGHQNRVYSVVFSPDGSTLASGSNDAAIKLWNPLNGYCLRTFRGRQNRFLSLVFSPDGHTLASADDNHTIKLWNPLDGQCLRTLEGHQNRIRSVVFSPDGRTLASGGDDDTIKLWNPHYGKCLRTLEAHQKRLYSLVFSPDGHTLASASGDHTIKLWNPLDGQCLHTLKGHQNRVRSVAFSPHEASPEGFGHILASCSDDAAIKLWNPLNGKCLRTLEGHQGWIWSVVFSPDGHTLASGSYDHTIKLWNLPSGQCLFTLEGHHNWVRSVVFSPDGHTLASGSYDTTIKLWSSLDGHCLRTLEGHQNIVLSMVFSPDGHTLVSSSYDTTIRFWDVQTGECLRVISDRLCEGLDITGVVGLTEAQKETLKLLGAVDR